MLPIDLLMINTDWFRDRLRNLKMSQRTLAKMMEIDPASVSYMLKGTRKMSMDEAKRIGDIFLVPVTEVMRQAGIEVLDDVRKIPINGHMNNDYEITLLPKGTHDMVIGPADLPAKSYAIQSRCAGEPKDGWLSYISGEQLQPNELLDRYCVCSMADGTIMMATLKRGYKSGTFNLLVSPHIKRILENKSIAWASRVLWIQPN